MPGNGMDRRTGAPLSDWGHVLQSIEVIFSTVIGSRVMRRYFGSNAPKLQDAPASQQVLVMLYVALAEACAAWEPRFELRRILFGEVGPDGQTTLHLLGIYYPKGHLGDKTADNGGERTISVVQLTEGIWRTS